MHALMTDVLGYERYLTYGEDVSANVNDLLAATHPEAVRGDHRDARALPVERGAGGAHRAGRARVLRRGSRRRTRPTAAYGHVQATRPDTLAAALNDSPAGLLAWLTEKLVEWSDTPAGDPASVERRISRERILTEAMIYWVTQTIGTSFRPYYEGADQPGPMPPVEVPAAVFIQRHEGDYPESIARAYYRDLRVFERLERGRPLRRGGDPRGDGRAHPGVRPRAGTALAGLLVVSPAHATGAGLRPRVRGARAAARSRRRGRGSRGRPRAGPSSRRRRAAACGSGRRSRA